MTKPPTLRESRRAYKKYVIVSRAEDRPGLWRHECTTLKEAKKWNRYGGTIFRIRLEALT